MAPAMRPSRSDVWPSVADTCSYVGSIDSKPACNDRTRNGAETKSCARTTAVVVNGISMPAAESHSPNSPRRPKATSSPTPATVGGNTIGFPYASFLLGSAQSLVVSATGNMRMGNHALGMYAQDTWKVTRKLTIDYGLRYDFQTYLREGAGRMPSFSPTAINPVYGRPGATIYDGFLPGRCQCKDRKSVV